MKTTQKPVTKNAISSTPLRDIIQAEVKSYLCGFTYSLLEDDVKNLAFCYVKKAIADQSRSLFRTMKNEILKRFEDDVYEQKSKSKKK